jgi:hypothetical protein
MENKSIVADINDRALTFSGIKDAVNICEIEIGVVHYP